MALDIGFNRKDCADALQGLMRQGVWQFVLLLMDVLVLSSGVTPACSFDNATVPIEAVIARESVRLKDAVIAPQMALTALTHARRVWRQSTALRRPFGDFLHDGGNFRELGMQNKRIFATIEQ